MTTDIQWLRNVEEIKQLKNRYGSLVDRSVAEGDAAARQLLDIFTEDFTSDFTESVGRVFKTPQEFREFFAKTPERRAWAWHLFSNPIFEFDGDSKAKVVWMLYALSTPRDDPHAAPAITYGRYYDEYVRTAKGWLIKRTDFKSETRKPGATKPA